MANQLIPPSDQAPRLPSNTTHDDALRIWIDLMKTADKLVMAGFVREVGPEKAREAYRKWFAEQAERHGQHMARLAKRLNDLGE